MSVEVLFLTVVLRKSSRDHLPPELKQLVSALFHWEEDWFREDAHLLATTFMAPVDVRAFGAALEARAGLRRGLDWAVADNMLGLTETTPWLSFLGGFGETTSAWLADAPEGPLARVSVVFPGALPGRWPTGRCACALNRDSHLDDKARQGADLEAMPPWGGRHLWSIEVVPDPPDPDGPNQPSQVHLEATSRDFMTYLPEPGASRFP